MHLGAGGDKHQRLDWAGGDEAQRTTRAGPRTRVCRQAALRTRVTRWLGGSWLRAGGDEKQRRERGRSGAGGRGLCLIRVRPHALAAPRRPGRAQSLTQLAMAEPTSGAGGAVLDAERDKRPPPEGEPAAPASGVLGMSCVRLLDRAEA